MRCARFAPSRAAWLTAGLGALLAILAVWPTAPAPVQAPAAPAETLEATQAPGDRFLQPRPPLPALQGVRILDRLALADGAEGVLRVGMAHPKQRRTSSPAPRAGWNALPTAPRYLLGLVLRR